MILNNMFHPLFKSNINLSNSKLNNNNNYLFNNSLCNKNKNHNYNKEIRNNKIIMYYFYINLRLKILIRIISITK